MSQAPVSCATAGEHKVIAIRAVAAIMACLLLMDCPLP